MTLAQRLAAFAASLSFEDIPDDVVASVRLRTLDVLGIALASSRGDWAPAVLDLAGSGGGECTVVGTARMAPLPLAILVNGTLAHGLDYDDTHAASITHASAVIVPTVLAMAEARELDGRTATTAAVIALRPSRSRASATPSTVGTITAEACVIEAACVSS